MNGKNGTCSVLFLYLVAFKGTGGIEKFNRAFIKALTDVCRQNNMPLQINSVYDHQVNEQYGDQKNFKGFGTKKVRAVLGSFPDILKSDVIVLGHINLVHIGLMIKYLLPHKKVVLVAHGIEVWNHLNASKQHLLQKVDKILAVSNFTRDKIISQWHVNPARSTVFPNTLDPFLKLPTDFRKPEYLRQRYGLSGDTKLILTVARLSSMEKYKGYDKVIEALPEVSRQLQAPCKYMLAGKYDEREFARLREIIKMHHLEDQVILPGFVKDEELVDHYLLADVFIMPSKKEGFGIVFIEAMVSGLPVVAGNQDGSVDALKHGELGLLVNPDDMDAIAGALVQALQQEKNEDTARELQRKVVENFGFEKFKIRLKQNIDSLYE